MDNIFSTDKTDQYIKKVEQSHLKREQNIGTNLGNRSRFSITEKIFKKLVITVIQELSC